MIVTYSQAKGKVNKIPDYELDRNQLQVADDIDIDDRGYSRRRQGYVLETAGNFHSLDSNGDNLIVARKDTDLVLLNRDNRAIDTTLRSDMTSYLVPTYYLFLMGLVYYSDGIVTGIIEDGANRTWGSSSAISSQHLGLTDIDIAAVLLYRPPPSTGLTYFRSRIYIVDGTIIFYSWPNAYELFALEHDYIDIGEQINMIAAVERGIFVGTDSQIIFLEGYEPPFNWRVVKNYGAVSGRPAYVEPAKLVRNEASSLITIFESKKGQCLGFPDGSILNTTEDFEYKSGDRFSAIFRDTRGIGQLITSLQYKAFADMSVSLPAFTATGTGSTLP